MHQEGFMVATRPRSGPVPSLLPVVEISDRYSSASGDEKRILESRLADGYSRIESAIARGEDVRVWEDFWISLLHSYEDLCDGIQQAA